MGMSSNSVRARRRPKNLDLCYSRRIAGKRKKQKRIALPEFRGDMGNDWNFLLMKYQNQDGPWVRGNKKKDTRRFPVLAPGSLRQNGKVAGRQGSNGEFGSDRIMQGKSRAQTGQEHALHRNQLLDFLLHVRREDREHRPILEREKPTTTRSMVNDSKQEKY